MSILSLQKQSQNTDFPNLRPSLDLRFALAKKLDPRITFTRGGPGTYIGPDGLMRTAIANEPRFDHDPISGQSLGLLIEESRSNVLRYSEDFTQTGASNWDTGQVGNSRIGNFIVAPDGNTTADKLVEGSTRQSGFTFYQPNTISGTGDLCFSVFAKAAERRYIELNIWDGNTIAAGAAFDLQTGTYLASGQTGGGSISVVSYGIIPYPNGWYRCYFVANRSSITYIYSRIAFARTYPYAAYQGDGTSGIYVWGAQTEVGSFPTSYIPTSASTVTRSADLASMTGTNFSSWYNQSEGTLYTSAKGLPGTTFGCIVTLSGSTYGTGNGLLLRQSGSTVIDSGGNATSRSIQIGNSTISFKASCSFSGKTLYLSGNGKLASPLTTLDYTGSGTNTLNIGRLQPSGGQLFNGTISRLTYYPIAITQNQLINLTS